MRHAFLRVVALLAICAAVGPVTGCARYHWAYRSPAEQPPESASRTRTYPVPWTELAGQVSRVVRSPAVGVVVASEGRGEIVTEPREYTPAQNRICRIVCPGHSERTTYF